MWLTDYRLCWILGLNRQVTIFFLAIFRILVRDCKKIFKVSNIDAQEIWFQKKYNLVDDVPGHTSKKIKYEVRFQIPTWKETCKP